MQSEDKRIISSKRRLVLWIILVITPFIAVLILCLATHTSLLHLDAYNTTWNDECSYLRAVRIIRSQGLPTGVSGYNEVASNIPAYGAYTILTYIPHLVFSFLTGISSHNFIYICNVLMVVAAIGIFVALVRPDEKKTIWLIIFSSLSLVYERYVWSGMSEAAHCAFVIVILACFLWLFSDRERAVWKERTILWFATGLILYFGMIRAFQFIWLVIPIIFIARRSKQHNRWAQIICIVIAAVACYFLYRFIGANWAAKYFSESSTTSTLTSYLQMLRNGQVGGVLHQFLHINKEALQTVLARLQELKWVGIVVSTVFVNELILLLHTIRSIVIRHKTEAILAGVTFLLGFIIYEANIMLYSIGQCQRMMLSFMVFSAYLICMSETWAVAKGVRQGAETALIIVALCVNPSSYALPQANEEINVEELERSLAEVLLFDEEDPWGNTIAKTVETENLYVNFCIPVYMNMNTCRDDYLENAIQNNEIKSKYIMLTDEHVLNKICAEKYEIVWQGDGHTIYLNR